jgi:hypothetical protein
VPEVFCGVTEDAMLDAALSRLAELVGDPEMVFTFGQLYVQAQKELDKLREAGADPAEVAKIGRRLQALLLDEGQTVEAERRRFIAERLAAAEAAAMN